ncbi:MAG: RraA family protein [Sedimentisphaerales bacterium]|jgi:4-hydroxy-4-methyl-2-oxoglutarate aldolase
MDRPERSGLSYADLLELRRWNTPTVYNGWEQFTKHDSSRDGFNLEPCWDFMPEMGPMVGYAVTVVIEPSSPEHPKRNPDGWSQYRRYVGSVPGPKIVVVQDLDKPAVIGAFWGEVNSGMHKALGCVGSIIDGGIRDLDEMRCVGFKALARRLCVGHAYSYPVRWDCEVEVFGRKVSPGQLIHADKHGFLVVPPEDEDRLLDAARFMDSNECKTMITAARHTSGMSAEQMLDQFDAACLQFAKNAETRFGRKGESL